MSNTLLLIILTIILVVAELLFIRYAHQKRIYDTPNDRSSHVRMTIRGGGVVNWFAALVFFIYNPSDYWLFFAGITIVCIVSFIDDIHNLGQWPRFFSHVAGITCVLFFLNAQVHLGGFRGDLLGGQVHLGGFRGQLLPWYFIVGGYIVFVGVLNAWNFMDGINGINGLYSLAVLGALQYVNMVTIPFADPLFIWVPMVACVVFLFFNFRKTAVCFAGDVGSISIAFWIITLLMMIMLKTHSAIWLLLIGVYGIDSVFTILHRLYLHQNIFEPHRLHFYQVLANECHIDHRIVSTIYALLQLAIATIVIAFWDKINFYLFSSMVLVPLGLIYFMKFGLMRRQKIKGARQKFEEKEDKRQKAQDKSLK